MKKRNMVVIVLIIALLLMGSAYALWTDHVEVVVTANSATMDVLITERTSATVTQTHGRDIVTTISASSITAPGNQTATVTLDNFIPMETVALVYKIENMGSIDVELYEIAVSKNASNDLLSPKTIVNWTIQKKDAGGSDIGSPVSGSDTVDNLVGTIAVAANSIELAGSTTDYLELELEMYINDSTGVPYSAVQETVFTIQPRFVQD